MCTNKIELKISKWSAALVNIEITQISLKLSAYRVHCEEDNVFFDLEFSSDVEEIKLKKENTNFQN